MKKAMENKHIEKQEPLYSKEQIIKSNKYKNRVDLLKALLQKDKLYTLNEVDNIIKKFMEREV